MSAITPEIPPEIPLRRTRRRDLGLLFSAQDALSESALRLRDGDTMGALRGARLVERLLALDARLSQRWRLDRELRQRLQTAEAELAARAEALQRREAALTGREDRLEREAEGLAETRLLVDRAYALMFAQASRAPEEDPDPAPRLALPAPFG